MWQLFLGCNLLSTVDPTCLDMRLINWQWFHRKNDLEIQQHRNVDVDSDSLEVQVSNMEATQRHPAKGQVILAQWLASEIAPLFHVMQPINHHNNTTVTVVSYTSTGHKHVHT